MKGLALAGILLISIALTTVGQNVETNSVAFQRLAEINNALQENRTREAIHIFKEMIAQCKKEEDACHVVETYFGFALALALNEKYPQSIRYHKKSIRLHKKLHKNEPLEMYLNLGLTYYLADKERKARKILVNSI
jgi:tetratricopeptide (TPR) repeat protein